MNNTKTLESRVFWNSLRADKEEIEDEREYLDETRIKQFLENVKDDKKNFERMFSDDEILSVLNIKNTHLTKAGALIFSKYPQMYFPQLSIHAVAYPGNEAYELGSSGERFLDNKNITGSILDMLEEALVFIKRNIRVKTIIVGGVRNDRFDYPINAIREAVLNALVHRDYSVLNERRPIRLNVFMNRIEIINPGGLCGDSDISQLDDGSQMIRNENIVNILEILKVCENRHSGIKVMRREMENYNLPDPEFTSSETEFKVTFYNELKENSIPDSSKSKKRLKITDQEILEFCSIPRSRRELKEFFSTQSNGIFSKRILPLVKKNELKLLNPEHPKSPKQKYVWNIELEET